MKIPVSRIVVGIAIGATTFFGQVSAHHSFAMFDLTQQILIEGTVTDWHYNNPHSWLHIEGLDANGEVQTWSFEGAARIHAARQGVNGTTFRKGERVRVIASPLRNGRPAGAMCFVVKEDGSYARPNDGTCNSEEVIAQWESSGWLESGKHLDVHEAAGRGGTRDNE